MRNSAWETAFLGVALAALQDQVAIINVLNNTSELSVKVDAAVIARPVVDTVVPQRAQNLDEAVVVTCVGRAMSRRNSGLSGTARTYEKLASGRVE